MRKLIQWYFLPFLLVLIAISLNGFFKPQFSWNVQVLSIEGNANLYTVEIPKPIISSLREKPLVNIADKKTGHGCFPSGEVVYLQNDLLKKKFLIEQIADKIGALGLFSIWITIIDSLVVTVYLIVKKQFGISLGMNGVVILVSGILFISILMFFNPILSVEYWCYADVKIQAELTHISMNGLLYMISSIILVIGALILIVLRYSFYRDVIFTTQSTRISTY